MTKIDIICPLYNAREYVENLHKSFLMQENVNINNIRYVITKGSDDTEKIVKKLDNCVYKVIEPKDFSHSYTREQEAFESDADIIVFVTQDVIIKRKDWLFNLTKPIIEKECVASYSRQICTNNSIGEAPLAISTLNKNLDLNIKEFVTVNFDSVAKAVDQLGGVTLNITAEETKYINGYIDETSKVTGKASNHITQAGTYNVDGVQAVAYSRIRYTSGGDYKRTERMRTVIEAMFNKLKTKSVAQINTFADKILPSVYTNITTGDIISMVPSMAKYKVGESIGWPYQTKGITMDRWYGVPVTLESNVTQLHKEAFGENDYTPSSTVKNVSESIIKKTGYTK